MRDKQEAQAEVALHSAQQVEDLRLDREVERTYWLVANDKARRSDKRAGDGNPLPLPAGELVRVPRRSDRSEIASRDDLRLLRTKEGRPSFKGRPLLSRRQYSSVRRAP
jgi:hypothetical protein